MTSSQSASQVQGHLSSSQGSSSAQVPMSWKDYIRQWYPDLLQRTHFLPHVYMYRQMRGAENLSGLDVAVPNPPVQTQPKGGGRVLFESDVREDRAQQHVLHCLREMADKQGDVMFVLSQLGFGDYLGEPCYAAAAGQFPRAVDLKGQELHRGDFDVLIIHRQYGLLVGEIKSVGANAAARGVSEQGLEDDVLRSLRKMLKMDAKPQQAKKQKKAGQLEKARIVLKHIVGDLSSCPRVGTVLILPSITTTVLRQALTKDPNVKQALCDDLAFPPSADPVDACLCSDQMSDSQTPHDVTDDVIVHLGQWWCRCMSGQGPDPAMSDQTYEELVARFAGPATVVQIHCPTEPRLVPTQLRTAGQYVNEAGDRTAAVALYPKQVTVIQMAQDLQFLHGPPGTGKTLALSIMGGEWIRQNHPVHVLSLTFPSRPSSLYLEHLLRATARKVHGPSADQFVHLLMVNVFENGSKKKEKAKVLDDAVQKLTSAAQDGELSIIADEMENLKELHTIYQKLTAHPAITSVRLWAASLRKPKKKTAFLPIFRMTDPLRSHPVVIREVQKAVSIGMGDTPDYTESPAPPACDGPPVLKVNHKDPGHSGPTVDCEACGREAGKILVDVLGVGQAGSSSGLKFKDVFVLTHDICDASEEGLPHDEERDAEGHVIKPASGLLRGLRQFGVPVRFVGTEDNQGVEDASTMSGPDAVILTHFGHVEGLERKIVVWVGEGRPVDTEDDDDSARIYAISRATAQLIWVGDHTPPSDPSSDEEAGDEDAEEDDDNDEEDSDTDDSDDDDEEEAEGEGENDAVDDDNKVASGEPVHGKDETSTKDGDGTENAADTGSEQTDSHSSKT